MENHNYHKCSERSFRLNLLDIQSELYFWHKCPQWLGLLGNRTRSSVLSSATEAKTANHFFWRKHTSIWVNEKYVDRWSYFDTTAKKIMNCKNWLSIVYLELKFDEMQNNCLTRTLVFLTEVELKNKLLLEKIELTHLF